jgi:hypothetical protein
MLGQPGSRRSLADDVFLLTPDELREAAAAFPRRDQRSRFQGGDVLADGLDPSGDLTAAYDRLHPRRSGREVLCRCRSGSLLGSHHGRPSVF